MIFGLGTVVVDDVLELDRYPEPDTKAPIRHRWRQVGGPVPTALVAAARLGSRCGFAGKWGNDPEGAFIATDLRKEGIDLTQCVVEPGADSGFAQIWLDRASGGRNIAFSRGDFDPLPRCELPPETNLLHLDGSHPDAAVHLAEQARARDLPIVLDAGSMKARTGELFGFADVVVASDQFRLAATGTADPVACAARLFERGVRCLVATSGANGAWTLRPGERPVHQKAFPIDAVDTTGAGDVFCGGLIHALTGSSSLEEAVRLGAAVAAHKCKARGNRDALPGPDDL